MSTSYIASFSNVGSLPDFEKCHILHFFLVDLGRNLSWSNSQNILGGTPLAINAVVELVVVFDKEFGDIFGHNRQSILDYLTVYMWDVNMRYTTLTRDSVRFRINGVVVIAVKEAISECLNAT